MPDIVEFDERNNLKKIYKLIQEYTRFNLYEVHVINLKTNEEKVVYRETKERQDFGRKLQTKREMLNLVNQKLNLVGDENESSK